LSRTLELKRVHMGRDQTIDRSTSEVQATIDWALPDPAKRGIAKQLLEYQERLLKYIKDPMSMDNRGFLRNAPSEEIPEQIFRSRVRSLVHQIMTLLESN
jgi:hypothetical protein